MIGHVLWALLLLIIVCSLTLLWLTIISSRNARFQFLACFCPCFIWWVCCIRFVVGVHLIGKLEMVGKTVKILWEEDEKWDGFGENITLIFPWNLDKKKFPRKIRSWRKPYQIILFLTGLVGVYEFSVVWFEFCAFLEF